MCHPEFYSWLLALNGVTGKSSRFALQPLLAIRFQGLSKNKGSFMILKIKDNIQHWSDPEPSSE